MWFPAVAVSVTLRAWPSAAQGHHSESPRDAVGAAFLVLRSPEPAHLKCSALMESVAFSWIQAQINLRKPIWPEAPRRGAGATSRSQHGAALGGSRQKAQLLLALQR